MTALLEPPRSRTDDVLADLDLLGAPADPELAALVRVAAALTGTAHATVNLLDPRTQHSLSPDGVFDGRVPRGDSLCAVITGWAPRVYAFADLTAEPGFAGNPFVDGRRGRVRAYASAPLVVGGTTVGTLCVHDERPHEFTLAECDRLADLAVLTVRLLTRRREERQTAELAAARAAADDELARSEAFNRALLEALPVGVVAADADGRVRLFNRVSREWHGTDARPDVPPGELPATFSMTEADGSPMAPERVPLTRVFSEGVVREATMRIAAPDRPTRLVTASGTQVRDDAGRLIGAVVTMADVTAQRALETALRTAALHDALTGLANRRLMVDRLEQLLRATRRTGAPLAVLYCDLDGFKPVNDVHGHAVGDEVLVQAARRLAASVRPDDTVARIGGDEFVVLCPGVAAEAAGRALGDRIAGAFAGPFTCADGSTHRVGMSVGVALCTAEDTPETALSAADAAMYRVKEARHLARAASAGR
ncbi:diguanylate cyclase domain-containing protein [Geodermatophilus sp. SYSU D00758]